MSAKKRSPQPKPTSTKAYAKAVGSKKRTSKKNLKRGLRVYLAGPIRNDPDYEAKFSRATDVLRSRGLKVFNPVEQDTAFGWHGVPLEIRNCLELDLAWICRWADVVALMPGWKDSAGALAEGATACAIGIPIWEIPNEMLS